MRVCVCACVCVCVCACVHACVRACVCVIGVALYNQVEVCLANIDITFVACQSCFRACPSSSFASVLVGGPLNERSH